VFFAAAVSWWVYRDLQDKYTAAISGGNSPISGAVWEATKPWNELQLFWFIPNSMLWQVL
jgi:hypothetical protein